MFESEWPGGPWRTVYYTDNLDEFVPGLTELVNQCISAGKMDVGRRADLVVAFLRPTERSDV